MFAEGGSGSVGVQMQPGDDAASTAVTHVCNSGESLTDISNHYYGTPHKWRLIFNANKDKLGSDMELSAGTVLVIPDAESGASGEDKGSSAKGTDESGDMPKVVPGDGNPDSTEALLKPKVDESPRKFGETVVEGDDANPFEAGKEGTEGGELDAASLQTPITGDAFTGSLTTVSWDSTQVNLGADHEQMDQVLTEVLGTNAKAIIEENKRTFEDLGAAIQVKQNELVGNISEYRSLMENSHGELRAHYTELHAQSQSTLADSFIKTGVFVDTVTEDQIQVMEARNKIFLKQIQNEEAERLTALQGAFATCRDGLKTYKGQWEGSYAQTVRAQAQVIRMSGDAYAAAAQQASVDEEGVAKKEAGKRGKAHAIAQARAQAGSATYKKYSPEFRKYAYMAADFLEKAAQSNVMLGDKLLAPTIDDLYPTEKKHVDQLAKHSLAEQHKVKDQVDKGTAGLKKVGSREVNNLGAEQKDAEMMLTVRRAHMNQRVENADLDLRGMYDKALGEASRAKDAFLAEASALANEEMNLIAPDKVQHAKDAAQEFAEERVDLLLDALSDDRDMALESLDEDRALQEQTMVDATASASEQIVATGNTIAEHQTSVTNTTVEQIDNAETQTQTVFQQVTDATANDAATQLAGLGIETEVGAANFQATVLERLNAYLQQASGQLESLREKMDSAATQSREAAQKAETKDIQSRVDKIAGATDRWGTDESALLTNMMGLSKAESGYLDTEFLRLKGKSLRSVILDETSKGDNVRESALAYLAGNATEGAKYAARYASDRWQNWFGTDTELLNKAMSSLTEEERDYLLTQDEDWPDLRDQLAKQLTEERTNSLFGANQYELDTFLTLTNKDIAYDDAHLQVKAIELTQAFQGTDNPFTWGTDEAKVWEVMEGLNGEDLEKFKALFAAYHGTSLEMELQDEMSGLELERGLAYANGDKALADMYGMEYALNRGKEQEAYEILEKRQNSGDWLDDAQNQQSLALTQAAYEQELGGKNGRAETLSGRIDQTLTEYTYETQQHGYGPGGYQTREISGISDTTDADLVQNMLSGKGNKAEEILYYAIRGAGTETAYVDKAIAAMKAELEQLSPEQRVTRMKEIKAYLKERGIDNPEEYLGIGQNKYDGGISELSGDQKNDLDQVWQQFEQDPSNVNHRYQRARDNYEWYRTKGATALGKAATDLYSDSGSDLDKRMARITSLYAEKGWYTPADGRVADSQEARDKWTYFKEQCELLDRQCKIYESTRDELADGICVVITTLVAIVTTVATLGAAMTVWAAALATFGAALLSVGLKAAIKGSGYSADDALKDVASAVLELAMQYVTLGMGKFAGVKKFFDTLDNGPLRNKVLSAIMQGAPGELTTALMDDKTWSSNADWGAIWGSFALKLVGQGVVGTTGAEGFKKSVGGKTGDLLADFFGNTASVVFDAKLMTSDNNEIAWALLKSWGTTAAANASAPYVRGMVARSLNRKWQSSNPTAADFERIRGLNQGAWGEVYDSFSDNVKLKIPRDLLDDQRANLQDQLRQTMGDAANEVATTIPTTVDTESTDDANTVPKKDDDVLNDDGPPVTGTGTGTGEAPPVIGDHVVRTLNEGSLEELMALGLTRHKAELIIAERETLYDGKKKPFTNISEAGERTHGVGDKTVDNLIAAEKRKMVQQETNSTINSQTFFDDLEALKKDFPKLSEHEVMKKVIWGEGPSGKRMFLSGTPIELDKLKQAGAFTRTMNLQEVYNYVLKNSAKVTLARQKIKNADDFGKAIANGTLDFNPEWLNSAMNLSGPLGWWALKQESTAVNAYQLEVDNATTPDKYKYGAIRFSITPDVAHTVGMQKPTAYDGMNFEEWTPETSGHTFGVTAGGKMEAVAPAVALGNATGVELFTQGGKKELATPTKLTTYEANTERVLKHIREGTKVPPVPKDLKDLYHSYGETGVHRQNGKTDETPKVRIEGEQLVIDAE